MSTLLFLRDVARKPLQMGAIAPSSKQLAKAMVDQAQIEPGQVIVELGGGSGSFTREIVDRYPDNPLMVFELSAELAAALQQTFPYAHVIAGPAESFPDVAAQYGITHIDRIVSGLPWALWSPARQASILDGLVPHMAPGGRMVTFHYVHSRALGRVASMRRLLDERFEEVFNSPPVWANVPPAYIHIAQGPRQHSVAAATGS